MPITIAVVRVLVAPALVCYFKCRRKINNKMKIKSFRKQQCVKATTIKDIKGRTIRKVMAGGGEFSSRRNFFSLSKSLYEFFLGHSMDIFWDWRT